ncbi:MULTISPECIES: hypothetical protein [unclassified Microbulbifer]|uniref:hypothetical protein n=1 Tax=unclassified Microbulbifer TaxID=2619833 RepID=UPI0027E57C2A|nr:MULTISPECIES: hypothetical protein [unclassified Microbulbifer]
MNTEEILIKFEKLEKQQSIIRWVSAVSGLVIIGMAVYLIGDHDLGYRDNFSLGNAIMPIGAALLGFTIFSWSGSHRINF